MRGYDIRRETAAQFIHWVSERLGIKGEAVESAQQAVESSDIIVTATVADEPIVKDLWLKKGSLFVHVGSFQEEEEAVIFNADKVVVDLWEEVLHRGTPLLAKLYKAGRISEDKIYANIGEIIRGNKKGRTDKEERIFFSPLGLGSEDIGVAPGAGWIATKGCGFIFCSDFRLIASAQWIACPTKVDGTDPDCSKAPHVVNNSWGGGGGDTWYQSYVRSWLMAGIAPVFSIGNSGSNCMTAGSPGDYFLVTGVGATDFDDVLTDFSSKGPGNFRWLKPDFVAPGGYIRSSVRNNDSAYAIYSGTSMSAPHVSGTIALMLSANPDSGLVDLYKSLATTTVRDMGAPPDPGICGGRSYDVYPNAIYGWGLIDASAAVASINQ